MSIPESPDVIPPGRAAVLMAVVRLHALNGRVTVREICAATGFRSTSTVQAHLDTLHRDGLIDRPAGKQGVLRPLVAVVG